MTQRLIELEGSSNFRDIGGYPARGGRTIRWGRVFRSGSLTSLTPADQRWLHDRGLAAVCDLRTSEEQEVAPTTWLAPLAPRQIASRYDSEVLFSAMQKHRQSDIGAMAHSVYPVLPVLLAPLYRSLFTAMVTQEMPLVVHCSAGQDRTGLAIGLLMHVLGVDRAVMVQDYLLSPQYRRVEKEFDRARLEAMAETNAMAQLYTSLLRERGPEGIKARPLVDDQGTPHLFTALGAIEARWGSIDAYLAQELGVGPAEADQLRHTLLDDA